MITLDPTIGGTATNTYNTLAELDAYAETASAAEAAAWLSILDDADVPAQAKAVFAVRAWRLLDTIPFPGAPASPDQAAQWPRFAVEAPASQGYTFGIGSFGVSFIGGYTYPPDVIPPCVKRAHAQLTVFLAVQGATDVFGPSDAGALSALKVGSVDITFKADANQRTTGRDYLVREIYPLLRAGNCVGSARSVRLSR